MHNKAEQMYEFLHCMSLNNTLIGSSNFHSHSWSQQLRGGQEKRKNRKYKLQQPKKSLFSLLRFVRIHGLPISIYLNCRISRLLTCQGETGVQHLPRQ